MGLNGVNNENLSIRTNDPLENKGSVQMIITIEEGRTSASRIDGDYNDDVILPLI